MRDRMTRKAAAVLLGLLLLLLGAGVQEVRGEEASGQFPELYRGKVEEILSDEMETYQSSGGEYRQRVQKASVRILDEPYREQTFTVTNYIDEAMAYNLQLNAGDEVYCILELDAGGNVLEALVYEHRRDKYLYLLGGIFVLTMLGVGGRKGLKSMVTLGITLTGVYYMLVGIINGGDPVFLAVFISAVVTVATMFLIAGFNKKAVSSLLGTLSGTLTAGILALWIGSLTHMTGLGNTEAQMLMISQHSVPMDLTGILFASIIIGTLGAVMDVSISISSAINELTVANPLYSTTDLFKSGMNIGRDVMGTMANTLILAYVGSSMFLLLVFMVNGIPYRNVVNMDLIGTEILRAMVGTIGIIFTIPATAIIASLLEKKLYTGTEDNKK
ncbi:YibE/F family protein [Anaerotalea alkaliphila]|uniref:YibE/F family protein n=1 Tax=Anaerotalea alkaliphila TaxID=2662126 RepID=A0A7X5KPI0_9FIRM|nr:YibE/F family protein [Anaerotalea alkaliphila]NDL68147.1 YibE/F family protein [Anaerotalea alkaliphila]